VTVERRLVTILRNVDAASLAGYDAAWQALVREVSVRSAHAWRYGSLFAPHSYIEFLEYGGDDPRRDPAVANALLALDEIAAGALEEWVDRSKWGSSDVGT